jgi:hypothetical protein
LLPASRHPVVSACRTFFDVVFSTYLQRAFHNGLVVPVCGFIFLPVTTIVYAWELNSGMPTAGVNLLWLLVAVVIDLGGLGGSAHRQSRR